MSSSLPLEIASTIQSTSIKRHPDVAHDLNPSTAASRKQPVTSTTSYLPSSSRGPHEVNSHDDDVDGIDDDDEDQDQEGEEDEDDIPYHVIRPLPRKPTLPPLPDMRFEQSYLASIAGADTYSRVGYITLRDQVLLPLVQGLVWTLALEGWRYFNRGVMFHGGGVGARMRRWWWRTNNWPMETGRGGAVAGREYVEEIGDYYKSKLGAGGD